MLPQNENEKKETKQENERPIRIKKETEEKESKSWYWKATRLQRAKPSANERGRRVKVQGTGKWEYGDLSSERLGTIH